jgi:hypothetical protein
MNQVANVVATRFIETVMNAASSQPPNDFQQNQPSYHRQLATLKNYYNPNDTYSPNFAAQYGSMLSPDSDLSISYEYFSSVVITVAAILAAGLIVFLLYNVGILFRCCCRCVRCLPHRPNRGHSRRAHSRRKHPNAQSHLAIDVANAERGEAAGAVGRSSEADGHLEIREVQPTADSETKKEDVVQMTRRSDTNRRRKNRYPWTCGRYALYSLLLVTSLIALGTNQFFLVGRQSVTDGLETGLSAVDDVQSLINSAINQTVVLLNYAGDVSDEYTQAETTCPALTLVSGFSTDAMDVLDDFESSMSSIDSLISPINSEFDSFQEKVESYYSDGAGFFILWALCMISLGLSWLFVVCERRTELISFLYCFVNFTYIVLILIQALLMFFTIVMGDLCGNSSSSDSSSGSKTPTETILTLLPFSGDVLSTAQYYTTCVGNDSAVSVNTYLHEAYGYTAQLTSAAQTGLQYCPNDPNLLDIMTSIAQMNATLSTLGETVSCPPIQRIWFKLVNDALCTEMYTGIFYNWGAALLTSTFLMCSMVLLSIVYQYWLPLEKMLPPKPAYRRQHPNARRNNNNVEDDEDNFLRMDSANFSDDGSGDDDDDEVDDDDYEDGFRPEVTVEDRF